MNTQNTCSTKVSTGRQIAVGDYDTEQPTLTLPPQFIQNFPPGYVADAETERGTRDLRLTITAPHRQAKGKRYKVVHHHGSARLSIPRWWLRERNAKKQDIIELFLDSADPAVCYLSLVKVTS